MKNEKLNEFELQCVTIVIEHLKIKRNPVKGDILCAEINWKNNLSKDLECITLRRIVNHIRCNSLAPICATNQGYFITRHADQIEEQIKSLEERANAILEASNGLKKFL